MVILLALRQWDHTHHKWPMCCMWCAHRCQRITNDRYALCDAPTDVSTSQMTDVLNVMCPTDVSASQMTDVLYVMCPPMSAHHKWPMCWMWRADRCQHITNDRCVVRDVPAILAHHKWPIGCMWCDVCEWYWSWDGKIFVVFMRHLMWLLSDFHSYVMSKRYK